MPITEQQLISGGSNPVDYSTPFRPQTPTVGQAASNEMSYYLGGYAERARQIATYGTKIEDGYDFTKHIPKGKESYATAFARTVNPQHAADVSKFIDERKQLRQDQSDTPIGTALIGSLANPVNYLAIPIGISSTAARATFTTIATRGAIATGASELALNVGIQMTDPVQSMTETFMNTATAAAFGGVGAGLFSVPTIRRANALEKVRTQSNAVFSAAQSMDTMGGVAIGSIDRFQPRKNRPLGDSVTVDQELAEVNARLSDLDRELATIPDDSGMRRIVEDDIEALKLERSSLADEVFYRKVEGAGVSLDDLYRPSKGADNVFINFVTNPLRRTLTDNYGSANNELKRLFVTLAADAGTQLNLHEMGIAAPLSVHQLATTDIGKFGATYDSMIKLWAEDTNAPEPSPTSLLNNSDVNLTSVARNVQGNRGGIVDWFTEVNQRRIAGGEMTSAQSKAAKMIDDYFASWEARLIETGQIRTRETLARKIDDVKLELDLLQSRVSDAPQVRQSDDLVEGFDDVPSLSDDIASLQRELAELEFEFENPVSTDRAEPFFPRYWNQAMVKKNREELKSIISNWFVQQPYIIRYNEATFKYERINLSSDVDQISARADEAIESILGNKLDETPVFTGKGRPSPLMSRQLDIPNSLVLKFIEQNPVNVMAAYTARTSSSYHFAKQFGGSRDKVVKDMNKKMVMAKVSRDKRAKTIRDFNHLYDRVVGRVIQEPDAWNQKAAAVLRDVTSFTYLGGAGIAAIGDFGRIVMEHEGQNIVRTAQAFFDPVLRKASVYETRVAGGAMDMLLGSAHLRMMDDQNYNVLSNGVMDRARNVFHTINLLGPTTTLGKQFSGALAGHYLIELSQKVARGEASEFEVTYLARHGIDTDVAKLISESPYQVDTRTGLILPNTSEWVGNYKVPTVDNDRVRIVEVNEDGSSVGKMNDNGEYVSAYYRPDEGGDGGTIYFDREHIEGEKFQQKAWTKPRMEGVKALPEDAFKTPREWANFVMLHEIMHTRFSAEDFGLPPRSPEYENKINQLAMAEHKKSQQVAQDTVDRLRVAINTSINNTVMMATAADKPIMMDGVIYVKASFGARLGLSPDPRNPAYSRIENAFLALPLQFYSYSFANVNKTVGLMMQNGVRSRHMGVAAMMGLGYMVTAIRTPDTVWQNMSIQDKVARSFDMGGIAALYSDLFYTTLQTSLAVGGPNITGGLIQPRFPQKPNMVDAVTNITGASSSWVADMGVSAALFASGDYGEGASKFVKNLPFSNLWFLRGEVNEFSKYLRGQ